MSFLGLGTQLYRVLYSVPHSVVLHPYGVQVLSTFGVLVLLYCPGCGVRSILQLLLFSHRIVRVLCSFFSLISVSLLCVVASHFPDVPPSKWIGLVAPVGCLRVDFLMSLDHPLAGVRSVGMSPFPALGNRSSSRKQSISRKSPV
mgnify:CR=1 FL=1